MRPFIPLLFLSIFAVTNIPIASATDESNLREICRTRVAGLYLNHYDAQQRAHDALKNNQRWLTKSKQALKVAQKKQKDLQTLSSGLPYDSQRFHEQQSLEQRIYILKDNIKAYQEDRQNLKDDLKRYRNEVQNLKKKIQHVFQFEKRDKQNYGYPFQVTWKSTCPQWRASCPLKRKTAQKLLEIWGSSIPQPCQRYANIIH